MALSNQEVIDSMGYFFVYPWDFFTRSADVVTTSYGALLKASLGSGEAIAHTLNRSAPLICAGLGVSLAFRAGLFNIGAQGQIILGTLAASYVGFTWDLPGPILLLASIVAGILAGAVWGAIAGALKAFTGAHEVISTIMLNSIAASGVLAYALGELKSFQRPGDELGLPQSPPVPDAAAFPEVFGVHLGVLLAIAAAGGVWWVLTRSTFGFELRSVGANPDASLTAGMSTAKVFVLTMAIAGALSGLAATMFINGDQASNNASLVGTVGFDAITVALLGRGTPLGSVLAGLLFGALAVGGGAMQTSSAGTAPEIVQVVQGLIVLFVAAPAAVRWLVRQRRKEPTDTFAAKGATA
ncbi:ABC transporter permease [Nocardioides sp. JQ2195]|nr:ABC transporter permease [Nocardioides sp. JQ2195]